MKHSHKTYAPLLLAAVLLLGLTACRSEPTHGLESDTEAVSTTQPTESALESAPVTSESTVDTTPESETTPSDIPGIRLEAEGGIVVCSQYPAAWEQSAAETLFKQFASAGTGITPDTENPTYAYRIIVGYTKLNESVGADFAAIGDLGYSVKAVDDKTILIIANTKSGMTDALSAFEKALVAHADGTLALPYETDLTVSKASADIPVIEGAWGENISYAQSLQNGVQTHFTDANRTRWLLSNTNVILDCAMSMDAQTCADGHRHHYASISNGKGVPYMLNTGATYLVDGDGVRYNSKPNFGTNPYNMYEMGYYYNNIHIQHIGFADRNNRWKDLTMEFNLHMYADKLNVVQHLVCTTQNDATLSGIAGVGNCYEIPAERVLAFVAKDANGTHDKIEDVDWNTAEYVAFDIERAGVIGVILLPHENSGKLTVTLQNGVYTVDQFMPHDPEKALKSYETFSFGHRLYTDESHSFDAFLNEAEAERHPLTFTGAFVEYDALRGAYKGTMPVVGWGTESIPNDYKLSTIHMTGDELDRKFYYYTDTGFGALECSVMLDENNRLLPIALEVTKNFNGENEDPVYDKGDMHYGRTFLPVTLRAGEQKTFTLAGLNMNWGKTPLKQLSSIQFFSPYYHLSLGPHESNCISPDGVNGKNYWTLPDFRPVGSGLTYDGLQYWANSEIRILQFTPVGTAGGMENCYDHIDSYGPVYADVTTGYLSDFGHLSVSYRHVELPNEDENRTLYSVRIDVLEDLYFNDFAKDFDLFSFNGRNLQYGTLTYLDENNEVVRKTVLDHEIKNGIDSETGRRYQHSNYYKLGNGEATYFGYYNAVNFDKHFHPNFALIIKNRDIVIDGKVFEGNFLLRDMFRNNMTHAELSLDIEGQLTLKKGDHIYFDLILLPWGRQYDGFNEDPNENDNSIQNVRNDSVINPFTIKAETGSIIEDTFIPKIRVDENGTAQFTVTGGASNGVVRVYGLTSYEKPVIEEIVDGKAVPYDNASVHGYDGYMIYADEDGTFSVAFAFDMEACGDEGRTFIVKNGQ